ncbi:hypothetical protein J0S82_012738, partial [Galemys pyrenaicus]
LQYSQTRYSRGLKSPAVLQVLSNYLMDKRCIKAYVPSQADMAKAFGRYGPANVKRPQEVELQIVKMTALIFWNLMMRRSKAKQQKG